VAQEIAAQRPGSIGHTKPLLGLAYSDLSARLETERRRFVEQITSEQARQGIIAFLEGRGR
jgi:enoyl-CoA hydratase/carnithine racemase